MSRSGPRNLADNAMLRVEVARRLADRILTSPPHQWADAFTTAAHQLADHTDTTDVDYYRELIANETAQRAARWNPAPPPDRDTLTGLATRRPRPTTSTTTTPVKPSTPTPTALTSAADLLARARRLADMAKNRTTTENQSRTTPPSGPLPPPPRAPGRHR